MSDISTVVIHDEEYGVKDAVARQQLADLEDWDPSHSTFVEHIYSAMIQMLFPIGFTIVSKNSDFNPNTSYPGTSWSLVSTGKAIVGAGSGYTVGATIGSANSVLPEHTHVQASHTHEGGEHTHGPGTLKGYYMGREKDDDKASAYGCVRYNYKDFNANSSPGSVVIDEGETGPAEFSMDPIAPEIYSAGTSAVGANIPPSQVYNIWERIA